MTDREKVAIGLEKCERCECDNCTENGASHIPWDCPAYDNLIENAITLLKEREPITGETSDGYHTFNELYHHRAVLFSVIVANYPEYSWKSKKHNDGTMYDGMFIVGIETPDGQATYHYDIDPYWDMFKCRELDKAPEWDGHTPAQAIERIGKLKEQKNHLKQQDCEHAEHDGIGCLGYCGCTQDDEPIESCKRCEKYSGNIYER